MKKEKREKQKKNMGEVILLKDLAPRTEVKGGAGKIVFGAGADALFEEKKRTRLRERNNCCAIAEMAVGYERNYRAIKMKGEHDENEKQQGNGETEAG